MTQLGSLFLIVLLVYLVQCICWVSPESVVFALSVRGRGKRKSQGFVWNAFDVAAFFANPLPPLSPPLVMHWPSFQLNPDSIAFSGPDGEPVSILWEKLTISHSGPKLFCNGTQVFKGNEIQVQSYSGLLQQLRQARRSQREQIIHNWLRKGMSTQSAARHVKVFHRRSFWLRLVSNMQFFFLFLFLPLAITVFAPRVLWVAIIAVVLTSITIAMEFWILHKELLGKAADTRFKSILTIALSPISAIRACDVIGRDLLGNYHPVAVASAICQPEHFETLAGEQLRAIKFGGSSSQWYQKKMQGFIEQIVRQKGLQPEQLLIPPVQASGCIVYCPRCFAQYVTERTECADCGYEKLARFKESIK
jgi:hypothetical protein